MYFVCKEMERGSVLSGSHYIVEVSGYFCNLRMVYTSFMWHEKMFCNIMLFYASLVGDKRQMGQQKGGIKRDKRQYKYYIM